MRQVAAEDAAKRLLVEETAAAREGVTEAIQKVRKLRSWFVLGS